MSALASVPSGAMQIGKLDRQKWLLELGLKHRDRRRAKKKVRNEEDPEANGRRGSASRLAEALEKVSGSLVCGSCQHVAKNPPKVDKW